MWRQRRRETASPAPSPFVHIVFAVDRTAPRLTGAAADLVERSVRATCLVFGMTLHAGGVLADHRHLAVSVPPALVLGTKPRADVVAYVANQAAHYATGGRLSLLVDVNDPGPPTPPRGRR